MIIFVIYFVFVAVIGVWISFLLMEQDREIRRLKRVVEDQTTQAQLNTNQLEEFYKQKKQFMDDKNNELTAMEARLRDEQSISALTLKNSETVKLQLKQQQEELVNLKSTIQKLNEQLQQANETRLVDLQGEKQKWVDLLNAKDTQIQNLNSDASSMESVMDTLTLISKEMHRRLDEHYSNMKLLDEKTNENLELMAQLEH